jgi:hypothetical protein
VTAEKEDRDRQKAEATEQAASDEREEIEQLAAAEADLAAQHWQQLAARNPRPWMAAAAPSRSTSGGVAATMGRGELRARWGTDWREI